MYIWNILGRSETIPALIIKPLIPLQDVLSASKIPERQKN